MALRLGLARREGHSQPHGELMNLTQGCSAGSAEAVLELTQELAEPPNWPKPRIPETKTNKFKQAGCYHLKHRPK